MTHYHRPLLQICLLLYVTAMATSMAAMEILAWTTFAGVIVTRLVSRRRFEFPVAPALLALTAVVGVTLWLNPPLKPFLIQFGFMRWIVLFWSFGWALADAWEPEFERRLVNWWMTVIAVMATYATIQFLFGIDWLRSSHHFLEKQGGVWRAPGTFSNVLTFAYALGTAYFAVVRPYLALDRRPRRVAVVSVAGLVTLAPIVRGAVIAAAVAVTTFVALARRRAWPYALGTALVIFGALALVSPKIMDNFRGRLENSANERVHLWRSYAQMFKDHPLTGVGLFQGDVKLPETYRALGITEPFTSHAHNVLLQWAGGAGIFALLLYLWISAHFLRTAWRLRDRSPWGWSLVMAQIYGHVGGLTEANFFDAEVNHAVVFTWALTTMLWSKHNSAGKVTAV